jgi:copper chaperone CopZ
MSPRALPAWAVLLLSLVSGLAGPADQAFSFERTALALTGSNCRQSYAVIIGALERLEGVARVEAGLVPDHMLVDHDAQTLSQDQLAGIVNAVGELRGVCHVAVMQSCITAGRMDIHTQKR